jgi:hypothetical protein
MILLWSTRLSNAFVVILQASMPFIMYDKTNHTALTLNYADTVDDPVP